MYSHQTAESSGSIVSAHTHGSSEHFYYIFFSFYLFQLLHVGITITLEPHTHPPACPGLSLICTHKLKSQSFEREDDLQHVLFGVDGHGT